MKTLNPVTGYSYRRYTLIRLGKDLEEIQEPETEIPEEKEAKA